MPTLLASLQLQVQRWIQNPEYQSPCVGDPCLDAMLQHQNRIGWTNFTQGCITLSCIEYQKDYYAQTNTDSVSD